MTFSNRAIQAKPSAIRETVKYLSDPEMISFAGGFPSPELFPVPEIKEAMVQVLEQEGKAALQYSSTDGNRRLREQICLRMEKAGIRGADPDHVLVTCGSQQGLDFSAKVFVNEGEKIITESISYPGAIGAFRQYLPQYVGVPMDDDGMIIDELKKTLELHPDAKMIYTIPNFQNPTGRTMNQERKQALAELSAQREIPVIEDNPYGELFYDGTEQYPSIKSYDTSNYVVYLGSMSKIFCPGFRVGWMYSNNPDIYRKYIFCKQTADVHTSEFSQRLIARYLETYDIEAHIEKIRALYKHRRDLMIGEMRKKFPPSAKFNVPAGGMFVWVSLPEHVDTTAMLPEAAKEKVIYVHGEAFYGVDAQKNSMRLSYSNMDDERIIEGIDRLATLLNKQL